MLSDKMMRFLLDHAGQGKGATLVVWAYATAFFGVMAALAYGFYHMILPVLPVVVGPCLVAVMMVAVFLSIQTHCKANKGTDNMVAIMTGPFVMLQLTAAFCYQLGLAMGWL